jgi:branched-subunit amino acid aminotransferase/4-amino-4-deoxychorismate lyase
VLYTAREGVLLGTVRDLALRLCPQLGIKVVEMPPTMAELLRAEEVKGRGRARGHEGERLRGRARKRARGSAKKRAKESKRASEKEGERERRRESNEGERVRGREGEHARMRG